MKKLRTTAALAILSIVAIATSLLSACAREQVLPTPGSTETPAPTATITSTPDPCAPENIQATITEFDKLSREFSDVFILAQNTAASQLSPVIMKMQEIRRRAEEFVAPDCLSTLKDYQLGFMNTAIDTSLLLYSSFPGDTDQNFTEEQVKTVVDQVNQYMALASEYGNRYRIEMAGLLGITLTPAPTLQAKDLPTSTAATATP